MARGRKINYDASFSSVTGRASFVAVLRIAEDRFIDGIAYASPSTSMLQAEARALQMSCLLTQVHNLNQVEIESDNQMIIHLCVSEMVPSWDCMAIVSDIQLLSRNRQWNFVWTKRSNNR